MSKEYAYLMFHIPSNANVVSRCKCVNRKHFLELLNKWNKLGAGDYVYYEVHSYPRNAKLRDLTEEDLYLLDKK